MYDSIKNIKIKYSEMSDAVLMEFIKNGISSKGCTYREVAIKFALSPGRTWRLVTELKMAKKIHISGWVKDNMGIWIGIYKPGDKGNVEKPLSLFASLISTEIENKMVELLPATKGKLGKYFGVKPHYFDPHLKTLMEAGRIVGGQPDYRTRSVTYYRAGEYKGECFSGQRFMGGYVNPIAAKRAMILEVPWRGYNKCKADQHFATVWRHVL